MYGLLPRQDIHSCCDVHSVGRQSQAVVIEQKLQVRRTKIVLRATRP